MPLKSFEQHLAEHYPTPADKKRLEAAGRELDAAYMLKKNHIPQEDIISESDITLLVQTLNANFANNTWELTTGSEGSFTAEITDNAFCEEVENGLHISKKDILKVQAHTISSRDKHGNLRTQYIITKVLEHIPHKKNPRG